MQTLSDQAYSHIQRLILTGRLVPGDVITESVVAEELGMSRTPVGEAIRQLVGEGLVEQVARKGAILRSFDRNDLIDLFDLRQAVESFAVEKAAERISNKQLEKLAALSSAMKRISQAAHEEGLRELPGESMQHLLTTDMAFHMLILHATGNRRMQRAIAETRVVFSVFRMQRPRLDLRIVEEAHGDHDGIVTALRNRQGEAARDHGRPYFP